MESLKGIKRTFSLLLLAIMFSFYQISFSQTNVSGDVWGTWTKANSPYYVTNNINIPKENTLIINPGVKVNFFGPYRFTINGLLKANGMDTNKITFCRNGSAGSWKYIYFSENAKKGCILDFCIIKDGGLADSGSVYIFNNDINVTISNCEIYNSTSFGIIIKSSLITSGGDKIIQRCNPTISNNSIHHHEDGGIYIHAYYKDTWHDADNNFNTASPLIKNNIIYANGNNGIECYTYANGAIGWDDTNPKILTNPTIQQNTFYKNLGNAIYCSKTKEEDFDGTIIIEANPVICSNIISKSGVYAINANGQISVEKVIFNNFWEKSKNIFKGINGDLGSLSTTNYNGDSCDVMSNIFFDPEFWDNLNYDFHLKETSKCINAGGGNCPWDADKSPPDIGAFSFDPDYIRTSVKDFYYMIPSEFRLFHNYPNPFNPETFISYQVPKASRVMIEVFNLLGQHIRTLIDEEKSPGSYQILWNGLDDQGQSVSSGVYLYKMKAGDFRAMKKMVLVR